MSVAPQHRGFLKEAVNSRLLAPQKVFPILELGRGDDLDRDLCDHVLERRVFVVLPGGAAPR
ncbi:hypothetical protein QA641_23355 [Bradyrhizobium sp. CB1650]|uniref:hypothetical protein n=1 Tax=Bradyrhizobium sp. CB1650 TaxID=3039153 RepID=UPI0024351783|nr:hypothetical protein [Bradyrhizobium sp. CB1650]WGD48594.1 hypothetical protein QA641_23355 [Bradyrhizobium sp. CB1650]